jgi:general L-amino acid transport system substrate-binding protein
MNRIALLWSGLIILAMVAVACEPAATASPSAAGASPSAEAPSDSAPTDAAPTDAASEPPSTAGRLATVMERGQLICGVNQSLPGFSFLEADGTTSGFDADYCRAIAAAVLGDPEAVEFRPLSADQRGPALQTGEVDVLSRNTTWTVSRDTSWGLFAPTTFYDGQGMMVNVAAGAETLEDLAGATICVQSGTTTELNLTDQMRALGVDFEPLVFAEIDPTYAAYEEGRCDAVTSDRSQLVARRTAFANPDDSNLLEVVMSKEPLGPVVPIGDDQWFNVVKWTVFVTFEAEEQGITQANVEEMTSSENPVIARLLGSEGELGAGLGLENDWVVGVISAVGNYGEIYDRSFGPETALALSREGTVNDLWTNGGLMYSPPFR